MLFIHTEDFFEKVSALSPLTRAEELALAARRDAGDPTAREMLVKGYLPLVAAHIRRLPKNLQTLHLIMRCCYALEKAVDSFDFSQGGETFSHQLSWWLRQTVTKYIAENH